MTGRLREHGPGDHGESSYGATPNERGGISISVSAQLDQLRQRIARGREGALSADAVVLLQDLETAEEELRVADEEVRAQHEQLARLLEDRRLLQWQHERILATLPVAVVTTDAHGRMLSLNAAFAALAGVGVEFALRKPVFSFVTTSDRSDLRRALSKLVAEGGSMHRLVMLTPRRNAELQVEAHVELSSASGGPRLTWVFLVPQPLAPGGSASSPHPALPRALVRLTTVAAPGKTTASAAREAVKICQEALGADVSVSLVLGQPLCPDVLAASTSTAQGLHGAQLTTGRGPTVDCVATGEPVVSDDLWTDSRWERLTQRLPAPGVRAVVAAPLRSGEQVLGALTVSGSTAASAVDVEVLASAVTAVLNELAVRSEVEEVTSAMERALGSRAVIDQAKGIVMADKRCGPEEAFQHLVSLSSLQHRKLREVAAELVRETGGHHDG